jgi:hypothetical protein
MEDSQVNNLIGDQVKTWTSMSNQQMREEWKLRRVHFKQQEEVLAKLIDVSHEAEMRLLDEKHEKQD